MVPGDPSRHWLSGMFVGGKSKAVGYDGYGAVNPSCGAVCQLSIYFHFFFGVVVVFVYPRTPKFP